MPHPLMRAAVARGGQSLAVERVARPEPGPGEARVRVRACGICGSDLHLWGAGFFAPGHTPGHEMAGVVDALGPGVTGLAEGQAVAVEPFRSCGTCDVCRAGRDPLCARARLLGVHEKGGLAEYLVAPADRLFPVPEDLAPAVAALAEPLAVCVHGLRRGQLAAGQRVLVLGAGSVGLLTLLAARALGAAEVWISARHAHQAERARELGAARVLAEDEARTAGSAADLVVETVGGSADTLDQAAAAVRPGGTVVVLGFFMAPVTLQTLPLLMKEVSMVWSYCYQHPRQGRGAGCHPGADFAEAVALLDRERERAARLATHSVPLDQVERAFQIASQRQAGALKVSVLP
jgi:L-iditol 2-dehydrogenase